MTTNNTTKIAEVLIEEEEVAEATPEAPAEPTIVSPTTKRAKVKGTWTMFWGTQQYNFVDGHSYDLPLDLFEHLKRHSNIYDTL